MNESHQIYIGDSESDAASFTSETFSIKYPLEEALSAAAAPVTPPAGASLNEPDYRTAPLEFVKFKFQEFVDLAVMDPVGAFKALPYTGAAAGVVFATLVGMLGVCEFTFLRWSCSSFWFRNSCFYFLSFLLY